jgi:Beta-lactamase
VTHLATQRIRARIRVRLDAPVAEYWPEFAAAGKAGVRVWQLLGHTSGLAGWTEHMILDDIYDMERSTQLLAQQQPWEPGTAAGYHGFTQGSPGRQLRLRPQPMDHRRTRAGPQPPPPERVLPRPLTDEPDERPCDRRGRRINQKPFLG